MTFVIGLTGSIGMGKSATAKMFAKRYIPVWDADAAVHRIYQSGGGELATAFPQAVRNGMIERELLREIIHQDQTALAKIEAIIHPQVAADRARFIETSKSEIILFDVPLLFETGADDSVDAVVVVSAPSDVQRDRVLVRNGMTETLFDTILSKQMPDAEKRAKADYVIETTSLDAAEAAVDAILAKIKRELSDA